MTTPTAENKKQKHELHLWHTYRKSVTLHFKWRPRVGEGRNLVLGFPRKRQVQESTEKKLRVRRHQKGGSCTRCRGRGRFCFFFPVCVAGSITRLLYKPGSVRCLRFSCCLWGRLNMIWGNHVTGSGYRGIR